MLWAGVAFLGFLQITAVVLNLLPIPGLDGYDALEPHLSPETQRAVAPAKQYGLFILLFVLLAPALNQWLFAVVDWFFDFSGVPHLAGAPRATSLTRFWSRGSDPCHICVNHAYIARYGRRPQSQPRRDRQRPG